MRIENEWEWELIIMKDFFWVEWQWLRWWMAARQTAVPSWSYRRGSREWRRVHGPHRHSRAQHRLVCVRVKRERERERESEEGRRGEGEIVCLLRLFWNTTLQMYRGCRKWWQTTRCPCSRRCREPFRSDRQVGQDPLGTQSVVLHGVPPTSGSTAKWPLKFRYTGVLSDHTFRAR